MLMFNRLAAFMYGVISYLVFFASFLYAIGFLINIGVPKGIDAGRQTSLLYAIAVNCGLLTLFAVQHSVMARPWFKRAWTKFVPEPIERSTYVLLASLALIILFLFWRPIPALVWSVENEIGAMILWALFGAGWLIVLLSTFLLNHFELFGLRQVWSHARGGAVPPPQFRQPLFYKWVRHPLYSGFFLAFWATPDMSQGHLLLAAGMSAYMLVGIRYEERDLVGVFGEDYEAYRRSTGMLAPRLRRRRA
jgi:protein-S-isoprenylcysteine O-methyltransferase Ste14